MFFIHNTGNYIQGFTTERKTLKRITYIIGESLNEYINELSDESNSESDKIIISSNLNGIFNSKICLYYIE